MHYSPRLALSLLIDELRAELADVTCPIERDQIADDLCTALDRLHDMIVPGAIPYEDHHP